MWVFFALALSQICISVRISREEALARLSCADPLPTRFEKRPNIGITWCGDMDRAEAIKFIHEGGGAFEAGAFGQQEDFGIYISIINQKHGPGDLFLATNPACRLNEQQLKESIAQGSGANIFCKSDHQ